MMPAPSDVTSPRLDILRQELEAGREGALEDFWRDMEEERGPLFETSEEEVHCLATFLWRGGDDTKHVVLVSGLLGFDFEKAHLMRLLDTDLWYRTEQVRRDTRTVYAISPNDPLTPMNEMTTQEEFARRTATWYPDPLNPQTFSLSMGDGDEAPALTMSVLAAPDAPVLPWAAARAGVEKGNVTLHHVRSDVLGNERRVWAYTPPDYSPDGEPYNLLIVFDGHVFGDQLHLADTLDNLIADGLIPPLVAFMIDNPTAEARGVELACHPPLLSFLIDELLPWAHHAYHFTHDPARTVVAGASLGGLAAAFIGFHHPEVAGNVLSMSGSFWWAPAGEEPEWLTRKFAATPRAPIHFYLDVGLLETSDIGDMPTMLTVNRHMRTVLQAREYPVHYAEFSGGHDWVCWQGSIADGLLALIGNQDEVAVPGISRLAPA